MNEAFINLPTIELMQLLGELLECYHDMNGFGGDTAEIYAYRLGNWDPGTEKVTENAQKVAKDRLIKLLDFFCERYNCFAKIDGYTPYTWKSKCSFDHRCHVKIYQPDESEN